MRRAVAASARGARRGRARVRRRGLGAARAGAADRRRSWRRRRTWAGTPTSRCPAGSPRRRSSRRPTGSSRRASRRTGYRLIWLDAGWWQGQRDAAGNMVGQPGAVAARHRLARRDAARQRLPARRLHRRRRDRLRREGRHVRPLPAGHQHARLVARRRGQGRLVRRRGAGPHARRSQYAQIHQAIVQRHAAPPDAAEHLQLPAAGPGPDRAVVRQLGVQLVHVRPEQRQQLAHRHRRRRAGQRAVLQRAAQPRRGRDPERGRRGPATGTTPTTWAPTRAWARRSSGPSSHVGDPRRAADDQRRHDDDDPGEPRRRSPTAGSSRSTRTRPGSRAG